MILLSMIFLAVPSFGVQFSSVTLADIHEAVSHELPLATSYVTLNVFPEKLTYQVSWGVISVGKATLQVDKIVNFAGTPAYHVLSEAWSNSFCDTFYKVRDINESWIDALNRTSLGYSKKLREGHFFRDEWVVYDKPAGRYLSKTVSRDGNYTFSGGTIPVSVQDILSSLYYVRGQDLAVGKEVVIDVNTKQTWPLVVRVLKRETIKTPAGKWPCVVVEPALRDEGIFIQKGRRLRIWLTDDDKKIPVLMQVEVFFGHITAELLKML